MSQRLLQPVPIAALLAAAGVAGVVVVAIFGPCDREAGVETDFPLAWDALFLASAAALGAVAGVLAFRKASPARRVRGLLVAGAIALLATLVALFLSFVVWANVCEGIRLDRY